VGCSITDFTDPELCIKVLKSFKRGENSKALILGLAIVIVLLPYVRAGVKFHVYVL
jgi:hypothetical protein